MMIQFSDVLQVDYLGNHILLYYKKFDIMLYVKTTVIWRQCHLWLYMPPKEI